MANDGKKSDGKAKDGDDWAAAVDEWDATLALPADDKSPDKPEGAPAVGATPPAAVPAHEDIAVDAFGEIESEETIVADLPAELSPAAGHPDDDDDFEMEISVSGSGNSGPVTVTPPSSPAVTTAPAAPAHVGAITGREVRPEVMQRLQSALDVLDDEEDVEMEIAAPAEPPPQALATDGDFYDDIVVEKEGGAPASASRSHDEDVDFALDFESLPSATAPTESPSAAEPPVTATAVTAALAPPHATPASVAVATPAAAPPAATTHPVGPPPSLTAPVAAPQVAVVAPAVTATPAAVEAPDTDIFATPPSAPAVAAAPAPHVEAAPPAEAAISEPAPAAATHIEMEMDADPFDDFVEGPAATVHAAPPASVSPAIAATHAAAAESLDVLDFAVADSGATAGTATATERPAAVVVPRLVDGPAPTPSLPVAVTAPTLTAGDAAAAVADPARLADELALLDAERRLAQEADVQAQLSCAGARVCWRMGDRDGARRRYEAALDAEPTCLAAVRGLRRVSLATRKLDEATEHLEREIELSGAREKLGLSLMRADVLLAAGRGDASRAAWEKLGHERASDLRAATGLLDAIIAIGEDAATPLAVTTLAGAVRDVAVEAALRTELGRLVEIAGDDAAAGRSYALAVGVDAAALAPSLGILRAAIRAGKPVELLAAQERVAELLGGEARVALERRNAALLISAGEPAKAADLLARAADVPSLTLRALAEESAGRGAAAAATLEALASFETEAPRRAETFLRLGELHERLGGHIDASHAYDRAAGAAPDDLRAHHAVERVSRTRNDTERLVEAFRRDAQREPDTADVAHVRAARLLADGGRAEDAAASLEAALAAAPRNLTALVELVELHLTAGRPADAARVLARAADAADDDPAVATVWRERAARLLGRAGDFDGALALVAKLRDAQLGPPLAWLEQRLLIGAGRMTELADALGAEAESTQDIARAAHLWSARGAALEDVDPAAAVESWRRALASTAGYPIALAALARRSAGETAELIALAQARLAATGDRPESHVARLRLAMLEEQARDASAAAQLYSEMLGSLPPSSPLLAEIEERLAGTARAAGDFALAIEALGRTVERIGDTPGSDAWRTAQLIELAELHEHRLALLEPATALYARALALSAGSPFAKAGLLRSHRSLGHVDELIAMAKLDLAHASEVTSRVAAAWALVRLEAERGDAKAAEQGLHEILAVDHDNHIAFRRLERDYLREERWADLVAIYEQMGLTAQDPALATAVFLDLARLRGKLANVEASAVDNDYRRALYRDPRCRPALRRVLTSALAAGDSSVAADLNSRLSEMDAALPRSAAAFATRAGDEYAAAGRPDLAMARYQMAGETAAHLAALRSLGQIAIAQSVFPTAQWATESSGHVLHDPIEKARAFLASGFIAQEKLSDIPKALECFRAVLANEPAHRDAFERLRQMLERLGDWATLAATLAARIEVEKDAQQLIDLHLDSAAIYRDRLGKRDLAKQHLRRVIGHEAGHVAALIALSDLFYADEQWPEAAEILIRRARIEKDPGLLKDIFFKLGLIYDERTPDTKRAVVSFQRVLQYDPDNIIALEHLSNLHTKDGEWKGALTVTVRLAELETNPANRVAHLHRVAKVHEEGFRDARQAHEAYRRAVEVDPQNLVAIGELARFYERQGDITSARVHLDRSVQAMRAQLTRDPQNPEAYHALFRIFTWRRSYDQATIVASLLKSMRQADAEEEQLLARFGNRDGYPGSSLGDPSLDETLFVSTIPPGFRHLFRLLDDLMQKAFRSDLRRLGVGKHEKLPRTGHAVRDIANRIGADMGVKEFDLYVTVAQPRLVTIELTEPLSLIISHDLLQQGMHEHELRFLIGRSLKMVQSKMVVPMRLSAEELGILVGGIVRQFVPDFMPRGLDAAAIAGETARLSKVIPRKLHQELLPFALECADPSLDLRGLAVGLINTANRAGVLCAGSVPPALAALRRLGEDDQAREVLRFAVSDELAELRRLVGTAVG